jgi:hypothetical protein
MEMEGVGPWPNRQKESQATKGQQNREGQVR